jgi:hypothetical protein
MEIRIRTLATLQHCLADFEHYILADPIAAILVLLGITLPLPSAFCREAKRLPQRRTFGVSGVTLRPAESLPGRSRSSAFGRPGEIRNLAKVLLIFLTILIRKNSPFWLFYRDKATVAQRKSESLLMILSWVRIPAMAIFGRYI